LGDDDNEAVTGMVDEWQRRVMKRYEGWASVMRRMCTLIARRVLLADEELGGGDEIGERVALVRVAMCGRMRGGRSMCCGAHCDYLADRHSPIAG
jgi:hypothetical protein